VLACARVCLSHLPLAGVLGHLALFLSPHPACIGAPSRAHERAPLIPKCSRHRGPACPLARAPNEAGRARMRRYEPAGETFNRKFHLPGPGYCDSTRSYRLWWASEVLLSLCTAAGALVQELRVSRQRGLTRCLFLASRQSAVWRPPGKRKPRRARHRQADGVAALQMST
jgi:hypothetical protein